ncbi:MAG: EcsC family protein [Xanthomonadales bacterium]|nr:EcsC family protein [Xanthomonadales bacterium]
MTNDRKVTKKAAKKAPKKASRKAPRKVSSRSAPASGGKQAASQWPDSRDLSDLRAAVQRLEHPGLAARLTSLVGLPFEQGLKLLPEPWYQRIHQSAQGAISQALGVAVSTMPDGPDRSRSRPDFHRLLGMGTGAVGGFFGLPGTLLELPTTTVVMLRAIADVAAGEGEDLSTSDARLACVQVFALGGRRPEDDAAETGYYSARMALAYHFSAVSSQLARSGMVQRSLPAAIQLVRGVAARFGVAISDKVAFQLVPVAGAISGALINGIFIQHFQEMARGHFVVRRLERRHGPSVIRGAYERLARSP